MSQLLSLKRRIVTEQDPLFRAYNDFREQVDMTGSGILPDPDQLALFLLMGVPEVPADHDPSDEAAEEAIDQRILILKKVFVELNLDQDEDFIDQGLTIYDQGGKRAKALREKARMPRAVHGDEWPQGVWGHVPPI